MGDEISKTHFEASDYQLFQRRMETELELLRRWEREDRFDRGAFTAGLELEAWLLDADGLPAPDNDQFLESLSHESVVPELAKFNFELNVQPQPVSGLGLKHMQKELQATWQKCGECANQLGRRITCIGILPTVTAAQLCAQNMTQRRRFAALNRQVFRLRRGEPLRLAIEGLDRLELVHNDVMLESAATSLQVHLKVPLADASRYFNAFVIVSTATVALAANAPLLFGKRLWHDSRIAVFEQAVDTGHALRRVSFGEDYAPADFLSLFEDKARNYPSLLPVALPDHPESIPHLRMHNGTLWLWNRPLIGFEADGSPHVRIEHRVMSAGPTAIDMFANVAFSIGLAHALAQSLFQSLPQSLHQSLHQSLPEGIDDRSIASQQLLAFSDARDNFYAAARHGLSADVLWQGQRLKLSQLVLDQWLPLAVAGLKELQVDGTLIDTMQQTVAARIESGQTAAAWQLSAFQRHRGNVTAVLEEYLQHQATRQPVHLW